MVLEPEICWRLAEKESHFVDNDYKRDRLTLIDNLVAERVRKDGMDYGIDERMIGADWKDSAATKVVEDKGFHLKLSYTPKSG